MSRRMGRTAIQRELREVKKAARKDRGLKGYWDGVAEDEGQKEEMSVSVIRS